MPPILDLRPANAERHPNDPEAVAHVPANVDAEQALLGCILYDNAAFERVDEIITAAHFYEPFHGRLFAAIARLIRANQLAEPILLEQEFVTDPGYRELGGLSYLADLVDRAPPPPNAPGYARAIRELSRRRDLIRVGGELVQGAIEPAEGQDSLALIEQAEAELYGLAETGAASQGFRPAESHLAGAVEMAAQAYQRDGGIAGLSTGLVDLDDKLGGLHPSDLIIIAARPSQGKSALAVNIGLSAARAYAYEDRPDGSRRTVRGGVVGFFSLEMSADQLGLRMLADVSGISGDRIRKGEIRADEFGRLRDAALELYQIPFHVDDTGGLSLAKLAARARRLKRTHGLDLLIVDYLQLITVEGGRKNDSRVQDVTTITTGLKALAKELNVPVVALSQLSRQVESRDDKRPMLSDLRESGSIEQDADQVLFIFREEYYLSRREPRSGTAEHEQWLSQMEEVRGLAELIIGKQRHGPIGTVRVAFDADRTKFTNLARDSHFAARKPYGDD
jgi:replicative DNA helicase